MKTRSVGGLALLVLWLETSVIVSAGDWTRFQGLIPADVDVNRPPLTWGPKEDLAWTADITGYGQSSPVIFGEPGKDIWKAAGLGVT